MATEINGRRVGDNELVYVIAELSANHCGRFDLARQSIEAAKQAGADAVKIQTYTADTLTIDCDSDLFLIRGGTLWDGRTLYELYQEASMPWDWQPKLKEYADSIGITLFSTPFDKTAVDFLEEMNVPAYKIASFEAVDTPLIEYAAAKGKPMIISTGICSQNEIQEGVDACYKVGNRNIILLKCTSSYPAALEDMNLRTISDMKKKFDVPVGLSDHTMNIETPVAATAMGICAIEKHFTLDRNLGGPDAGFSLTIEEFSQMVEAIRNTERLLGVPSYEVSERARAYSRSLFVVEDVKAGEQFTEENVRSIRPAGGLPPKRIGEVIGKLAAVDLKAGTPLRSDHIA